MEKLQIHQLIKSHIYGGRTGYITKIEGEQTPETIKELGGGVMVTGGSAQIYIRFVNGTETYVPESIVHGTQWTIGELLNEDEIKAMDEEYQDCKQATEDQANAKKRADEKEIAELPAKYPYLEIAKGRKGAMNNIRITLKHHFPGIKFSVTNPHASTCEIRWIDGPTVKSVNELVHRFEDHHMDQSGDFSDYDPSNFNEVFGGMQYVFTTRSISYELKQVVCSFTEPIYNDLRPNGGEVFNCMNDEEMASDLIGDTSIPVGAKVTGILRDAEKTAGSNLFHEWYSLILDVPQRTQAPVEATTVDGVTVRENEEKNGVEIIFPDKPNEQVRQSLKDNRFRWSRPQKLWYAQRNERTLNFAKSLIS